MENIEVVFVGGPLCGVRAEVPEPEQIPGRTALITTRQGSFECVFVRDGRQELRPPAARFELEHCVNQPAST
jgi:hypothetical protein